MTEHRSINETPEEFRQRVSPSTDHTVTFTERAMRNLRQMGYRIGAIEADCGRGSQEHVDAMESLINSLIQTISLGGQISAEDDLSLYGVSFIHYGVIFHHDHGKDGSICGTWSVHS